MGAMAVIVIGSFVAPEALAEDAEPSSESVGVFPVPGSRKPSSV
jgi:hypothetical protein